MKKALHEVTTWKDVLGGLAPYFRFVARGGVIFEVGHDDQTTAKADMYSLILRPTQLTNEWSPIAVGHVNECDEETKIVDCVGVSLYADDLDRLIDLLKAARDTHQQRVKAAEVDDDSA